MDALLWLFALVCLGLGLTHPAQAINCYTCSSHNGSDPNCEDPFHPAHASYQQKCMVPKTGHIGVFPANFCIKLIGTSVDTGELMVIRACVRKTMDSQCGSFRYQDQMMKGCILTCDYDGCNAAPPSAPAGRPLALVGALAALAAARAPLQ